LASGADAGVTLPSAISSNLRGALPLAPAALQAALEGFFTDNPRACVVEDGVVLFDMALARWSVDASGGRCVLQLWSEERTLSRTILTLQERSGGLRLEARRFGQAKPQILRLAPDRDQRTPTARETGRRRYAQLLARVLSRQFPDCRLGELTGAADLEHSFGPAYVRGLLERGQTAWALVGINGEESQSAIDGLMTIAILWLERCRKRAGGRRLVEGVKLIAPAGMDGTLRERLAWVHAGAAKWELYTLDAAQECLEARELQDGGNVEVRLMQAFRPESTLDRFAGGRERVLGLLSVEDRGRAEVLVVSPSQISFRLHGLEFARIRHGTAAGLFTREDRISFGAGASETPLTDETEPLLRELVGRLFASRHPKGSVRDPLYRLQPERWLESVLRLDLAEIESTLRPTPVYTQVPAMASADRGMLDLLAVTREGRLAVLELKTSEDLHMPLQGLDYWLRVRALHAAGEIARAGYFPGVQLSPEPPLLYFVVPALRVHSTLDTVLRYLAPEVEWRLLALDERWRQKRAVVFRKSGGGATRWARVLAGES
jgi:hypothetical protein